MNRFVLATALACATLAPSIQLAEAQMPAEAIGTPRAESTMTPGTVTVRIIAGAMSSAVADAEATLLVNGEPRTAKSDGSGRATFAGLPIGATAQAKIVDAEGKPQVSQTFTVPPTGGIRLLLTTKPFTGGPASHTAGVGAAPQGTPEARAMSGQPRPDQTLRPGTYQVRLTYNSMVIKNGLPTDPEPPLGEHVTLVGYKSDDTIDVRSLAVDAKGYATFEDLDVSGHTVYFALARLPRAGGVDRVMAVPVQPDTQVGAKSVLSGDKRTATTQPIDEVMTPQSVPTPAGKVRVTLEGVPTEASTIVLFDATTKTELGRLEPTEAPPNPGNVRGGAKFEPVATLPAGALTVRVHGGPAGTDAGLPDISIRVIPADAPNSEGVAAKTTADGTAKLDVPPGVPLRAVFNVNGKDLVSAAFEVTKSGGNLEVPVEWEAEGRPQAVFDVEYKPDRVIYAETRTAKSLYRSRPIQLIESGGSHLPITVYPRVMVNFSLQSAVEDEILGVRGTYTVENVSWSPYAATSDGMVIPLPKGFKGGKIADEHQNIAAIAPGEGIRILRPLAPGRTMFRAGFSLFSSGGELEWRLDLPMGTYQSGMEIKLHDGMTVRPRGSKGRVATSRDGSQWFVLDTITIRPGQSMLMNIDGMPSQPAWRLWVPRLVGVLVVALMLGGILLALMRRGPAVAPTADKRRTALLDELVELERTGKDPARRDQVLGELERLWRA